MTTSPAPAVVLAPGMTCNRGKGKTLWEIIEINEHTHMVSLSALGKGGYTNKHTTTDELTNVQPQQLLMPLHRLLAAQVTAKAAASDLSQQLRFVDASKVRVAADKAIVAAGMFEQCCRVHADGLADLGIGES